MRPDPGSSATIWIFRRVGSCGIVGNRRKICEPKGPEVSERASDPEGERTGDALVQLIDIELERNFQIANAETSEQAVEGVLGLCREISAGVRSARG